MQIEILIMDVVAFLMVVLIVFIQHSRTKMLKKSLGEIFIKWSEHFHLSFWHGKLRWILLIITFILIIHWLIYHRDENYGHAFIIALSLVLSFYPWWTIKVGKKGLTFFCSTRASLHENLTLSPTVNTPLMFTTTDNTFINRPNRFSFFRLYTSSQSLHSRITSFTPEHLHQHRIRILLVCYRYEFFNSSSVVVYCSQNQAISLFFNGVVKY